MGKAEGRTPRIMRKDVHTEETEDPTERQAFECRKDRKDRDDATFPEDQQWSTRLEPKLNVRKDRHRTCASKSQKLSSTADPCMAGMVTISTIGWGWWRMLQARALVHAAVLPDLSTLPRASVQSCRRGDVLFVAGSGLRAKLIGWFLQSPWTHTNIIVQDKRNANVYGDNETPAMALDIDWGGISHLVPVSSYVAGRLRDGCTVLRLRPPTHNNRSVGSLAKPHGHGHSKAHAPVGCAFDPQRHLNRVYDENVLCSWLQNKPRDPAPNDVNGANGSKEHPNAQPACFCSELVWDIIRGTPATGQAAHPSLHVRLSRHSMGKDRRTN